MTPAAFPAVYRKRLLLLRNPAIPAEIAAREIPFAPPADFYFIFTI